MQVICATLTTDYPDVKTICHYSVHHTCAASSSTAWHATSWPSSTAQHSTAQHLKNLVQALGRERCERHLCQLVIQAGGCRFGQVIQHCQAPQQASHFHRANSLQGRTKSHQLVVVAYHTDLCLQARMFEASQPTAHSRLYSDASQDV